MGAERMIHASMVEQAIESGMAALVRMVERARVVLSQTTCISVKDFRRKKTCHRWQVFRLEAGADLHHAAHAAHTTHTAACT